MKTAKIKLNLTDINKLSKILRDLLIDFVYMHKGIVDENSFESKVWDQKLIDHYNNYVKDLTPDFLKPDELLHTIKKKLPENAFIANATGRFELHTEYSFFLLYLDLYCSNMLNAKKSTNNFISLILDAHNLKIKIHSSSYYSNDLTDDVCSWIIETDVRDTLYEYLDYIEENCLLVDDSKSDWRNLYEINNKQKIVFVKIYHLFKFILINENYVEGILKNETN